MSEKPFDFKKKGMYFWEKDILIFCNLISVLVQNYFKRVKLIQ